MFKKLSTSFNLVKVLFKYIKRDGELLMYSLFSLIASMAILATFIGVDFYFLGFIKTLTHSEMSEGATEIYMMVYTFLYYLIFSFITFFFNTAIITSVQRRNNGEDNKLWDGLRDAMKNIKSIFIWSLISATVSTILKLIQRKFGEDSIVGSIIVGLIGWAWNILTFFSFPLMIVNKVWVKDAIKESGSLFKKTWGERAIIHVWVGLMFFFMYLIVIAIWVAIAFAGSLIAAIIFVVAFSVFLVILSSTTDTIIKTVLLYYAQHGRLPAGLEHETAIIDIAGEKK